ncbi:MAG TPA: tannase/feruloyl esterase family alpha/beta hydrolase [Streptosporangiaceae bacterium]|jgi:feruloyl esterase
MAHRFRSWPIRPRRAGLVAGTAVITAGLLAGAAPAVSALAAPAVTQVRSSTDAACTTASLQSIVTLPHVTVTGAAENTTGSFTPPGTTTPITGLPAFCDVTLTQTDPSGNGIHIEVWLPKNWNGNFQGVGGGGYSCGITYSGNVSSLSAGIQAGYATASTDCGHTVPPGQTDTGSWALNANGTLNWALIRDFASVGIHDMSTVGKAVTNAFYPSDAKDAYFVGCSTGGREGLMEAQQFPADYNGIVSGAPAINWTKFIPSEIWPELVMNESHDFLPTCIENAFTESAVKACTARDAVTDGWITDPMACDWSPYKLVGTVTPCGTITAQDAAIMLKIWNGPVNAAGKPLWYGLERGASLAGLAGTTTSSTGVTSPSPFFITVQWLGTWLQKNPSWNWQTMTYAQFNRLFAQSVNEFSNVIATDNPDLSAFKKDGGKIILWHGLADELIFPMGTINYYQRVQQAMGGAAATDTFARLFLAPGAQHCASAAGPAPADPLSSLAKWVTKGQAPTSILATVTDPTTGVVTLSRPLCAYPEIGAQYTGHGSTSVASNFTCRR